MGLPGCMFVCLLILLLVFLFNGSDYKFCDKFSKAVSTYNFLKALSFGRYGIV